MSYGPYGDEAIAAAIQRARAEVELEKARLINVQRSAAHVYLQGGITASTLSGTAAVRARLQQLTDVVDGLEAM